MKFIEDSTLSGVRKTTDGYLVGEANVARTGIQLYTGDEVGLIGTDVVRVYRPESEVFKKASLATYSGKPTTNDHPPVAVDSENWKDFAVGVIGEEIARDGEKVRVPFTVMDQNAISDIEGGKREISMGYTTDLVFEEGVTAKGEAYDAIQTNLRMNHLAIVQRGRAGHECRIGDSKADKWGVSPITIDKEETKVTIKTKTVMLDGLPVETTDAGAAAIDKLQKDLAESNQLVKDQAEARKEILALKDKELATKDAEIADLKGKVLDDADLDARVQKRADLIADAALLSKDVETKGKSEAEIKKACVLAVRGADSVADRSEAYIEASFDIALDAVKDADPVKQAMLDKTPTPTKDNGQGAFLSYLQNKEAK